MLTNYINVHKNSYANLLDSIGKMWFPDYMKILQKCHCELYRKYSNEIRPFERMQNRYNYPFFTYLQNGHIITKDI